MDISPEMVSYSQTHRRFEERDDANPSLVSVETEMRFEMADAGDPSSMLPEWESKFDLLTSFTALHWVPDQKKVLHNIRYCLKSGGFVLLLIPVKAPRAFLDSKSRLEIYTVAISIYFFRFQCLKFAS